MQLSDADLLCAAQSGGESNEQAKQELPIRFERLLLFLAHHACRLNNLPTSEADDIIQLTLLKLFTTQTPFDPARSDGVEAYLRGLVQTAARTHRRFLRRGPRLRHDWGHPDNGRRGLPTTEDAIPDTYDPQVGVEARDVAVPVLAMASAEERGLVHEVHYRGNTIKNVATASGVDPSTVSRKLIRFYARVLARGWLFYADNQRFRN